MKIRQGFVSNSSSSSFLIIGVRTDLNKITDEELKNNKYVAVGEYLEEGLDVFNVDSMKLIESMNSVEYTFEVYRVFKKSYDDIHIPIKKEWYTGLKNDEELTAIYGTADHNSSDEETIFDNYKKGE